MTTKKMFVFLSLFLVSVLACKGSFDLSNSEPTSTPTLTPTLSITSTLTPIPPPTFTPTPEFRVIPDDYYRITTWKLTSYDGKKQTRICIKTNTHRIISDTSEDVVEIIASSAYQAILGDCSAYKPNPEEAHYYVNVFTGELTQGEIDDGMFLGKNYQGNVDEIFSLAGNSIPVWKITKPITRENMDTGEVSFTGTDELLVDKATGIMIYGFESLVFVENPRFTSTWETISVITNAPIGGRNDGTEFSYSTEN